MQSLYFGLYILYKYSEIMDSIENDINWLEKESQFHQTQILRTSSETTNW